MTTTMESDGGSVMMEDIQENDKQSELKPGIMGVRGSLRSRRREGEEDADSNANNNSNASFNTTIINAGHNDKESVGRSSARIKNSAERDSTSSGPSGNTTSTSAGSNKRSKVEGVGSGGGKGKPVERWRAQRMAEDYVNLVGDLMYPKVSFGPYGYDMAKGEIPLERPNTLGVLMCPARRRTVMEHWSPFEVACFEGAIVLVGKNFYEISKLLPSKSTKECIEFYYVWKMTSHYQQWKRSFEPLDPHPFSILPPDE